MSEIESHMPENMKMIGFGEEGIAPREYSLAGDDREFTGGTVPKIRTLREIKNLSPLKWVFGVRCEKLFPAFLDKETAVERLTAEGNHVSLHVDDSL